MWECGLKRNLLQPNGAIHAVTPYVGVWIETGRGERSGRNCGVTPYVGVWIETHSIRCEHSPHKSLLMWECGLKQLKDLTL